MQNNKECKDCFYYLEDKGYCTLLREGKSETSYCDSYWPFLVNKPVLAMDETDKQHIALNMIKYGGSFVKGLGEALLHSDQVDRHKIARTWPELIEEYSKF